MPIGVLRPGLAVAWLAVTWLLPVLALAWLLAVELLRLLAVSESWLLHVLHSRLHAWLLHLGLVAAISAVCGSAVSTWNLLLGAAGLLLWHVSSVAAESLWHSLWLLLWLLLGRLLL
jgi:hypothetical protein